MNNRFSVQRHKETLRGQWVLNYINHVPHSQYGFDSRVFQDIFMCLWLLAIISNVKHFCAVHDGVAFKCSYPSADISETWCHHVSDTVSQLWPY